MTNIKQSARPNLCLICNAEAFIVNYGALSCYSCKTFFRRHAHRARPLNSCRYDACCEINVETRKSCIPCRLMKCFAVGMSIEFIRKDFQYKKPRIAAKLNSKEIVQLKIFHKSLPQIYPLNLLQNDRSALTTFEWRLFSNVVNAFERFSVVPAIQYVVGHSFYTFAQSFVSSTADFRVLTTAEQRSLFQRNLHGLFNFAGTLMLRDGGIFESYRNETVIMPLYGYEAVQKARSIIKRLGYDSTLAKAMVAVFAFSTNCFTVDFDKDHHQDALLHGEFRLLGSQNMYVEILWTYMLYRYSYMEAALRFAGLVKHMLDLIILSSDIYTENVYHQQLVDDVVEQAKNTLTLSDIDETPLWGKLDF
ncbi:unnamed protein product [Adineta ricciae]|uniref:Nuclear receptor domain-containing protein n=1 Tax=Adineta ricciae TaxID=249248 RepID=A0A815V223_ADIRI|nr:unnamed protein product [Adineta ricciae]